MSLLLVCAHADALVSLSPLARSPALRSLARSPLARSPLARSLSDCHIPTRWCHCHVIWVTVFLKGASGGGQGWGRQCRLVWMGECLAARGGVPALSLSAVLRSLARSLTATHRRTGVTVRQGVYD